MVLASAQGFMHWLVPFGGWLFLALFIPVLAFLSARLKHAKSAAVLSASRLVDLRQQITPGCPVERRLLVISVAA